MAHHRNCGASYRPRRRDRQPRQSTASPSLDASSSIDSTKAFPYNARGATAGVLKAICRTDACSREFDSDGPIYIKRVFRFGVHTRSAQKILSLVMVAISALYATRIFLEVVKALLDFAANHRFQYLSHRTSRKRVKYVDSLRSLHRSKLSLYQGD